MIKLSRYTLYIEATFNEDQPAQLVLYNNKFTDNLYSTTIKLFSNDSTIEIDYETNNNCNNIMTSNNNNKENLIQKILSSMNKTTT